MHKHYITKEHGAITRVACNLCDATLQSLTPLDSWKRVVKAKNGPVHQHFLLLSKTPLYREIKFELTKGVGRNLRRRFHVHCLCSTCVYKIQESPQQHLQKIWNDVVADNDFAPTKEEKADLLTWRPTRIVEVGLTTEPVI